MTTIMVVEDFGPDLGGRYRSDGPRSGEAFRTALLIPRLETAIGRNERLTVNFDDVSGIPTSFLEEAFGGMVRVRPEWSEALIRQHLAVEAPGNPSLAPLMALTWEYIRRAFERRRNH